MKSISRWASIHKHTAWALIALIHISVILLAFYIGIALQEVGVLLPKNLFDLAGIGVVIIVVLIYPQKHGRPSFTRQKICDFFLPFAACLILIATINNADNPSLSTAVHARSVLNLPGISDNYLVGKPTDTILRSQNPLQKNILKQLKKSTLSKEKADPEKAGKTKKTLLIILAVLVMLGLLGVLAVLVCTIACGSGWVLAVLAGAVGLAGIILAFAAVVRRIRRGPRKKNPVPDA